MVRAKFISAEIREIWRGTPTAISESGSNGRENGAGRPVIGLVIRGATLKNGAIQMKTIKTYLALGLLMAAIWGNALSTRAAGQQAVDPPAVAEARATGAPAPAEKDA